MCMICSSVLRNTSFGRYCAYPNAPLLRGMMVTFRSGSACSRNHPATACPASWWATIAFSSSDMILLLSSPPMMRSVAFSKSSIVTESALRRAATIAASLHTLAMSAPANPGVSPASRPAMSAASPSSLIPFRWIRNTSFLPLRSGRSTVICRSNLPGRVSALSRMSTRFVPARTTTPVEVENPSISTSNWFRVFSLSSFPPPNPPRPRCLPTASISSMKTMQGALARASLKRSLTLDGPTPTNISKKSDPEML
mmetsp:Transcript_8616/g.18528  ORF Transcript_8616/g.18528 Transcript_8616/m.18528 type:complete len:254 (-) Transcript_8616:254-1015(-)